MEHLTRRFWNIWWYCWLELDVISKVTSTAFFYCILLLSESHQDLFYDSTWRLMFFGLVGPLNEPRMPVLKWNDKLLTHCRRLNLVVFLLIITNGLSPHSRFQKPQLSLSSSRIIRTSFVLTHLVIHRACFAHLVAISKRVCTLHRNFTFRFAYWRHVLGP